MAAGHRTFGINHFGQLPLASRVRWARRMRVISWIGSAWLATLVFWLLFAACVVEGPPEPTPPAARLVAAWDPLACGAPHRVVVELEGDDGVRLSSSTSCVVGGLTLDVPHLGVYRGQIYAWVLDQPPYAVVPVSIAIDAPVVQWQLTPP